jgi:hypothetical protein
VDLARPVELQEVDFSIVGVQEYFLSDLLEKIWDRAVPDFMKTSMVPLHDEFVKGYSLSRALLNDIALASQELFAKVVQKAMVVSCTIMFCLKASPNLHMKIAFF